MHSFEEEEEEEKEEAESADIGEAEEGEDLALDDFKGEGQDGGSHEAKEPKREQTKEERARQAEARRRREAERRKAEDKRIADEAYVKGQLDSTKKNPYTNEPVKDEYDLKVLRVQRQIEEEGGDPITDLPAKLAELDRAEAKKKAEEAKKRADGETAIESDIADFRKKYPSVDPKSILGDGRFASFSRGKLGSERLADIYAEFTKTFGEPAKKSDDGRKKGAAPNPNGGKKADAASYSKMSKEQKIAYLKSQGLI